MSRIEKLENFLKLADQFRNTAIVDDDFPAMRHKFDGELRSLLKSASEEQGLNPYLRDWVSKLPLRHQGVLIVATRGCDVAPKNPLDSTERQITAAIRYAIGNPFDQREVDSTPGCFMLSYPPAKMKLSSLEHYPLHYVIHLMHACEVIGYCHPSQETQSVWMNLYLKFCHGLHLNPETAEQMHSRLTEDRIVTGEIVS